jgi:hypothetical protein
MGGRYRAIRKPSGSPLSRRYTFVHRCEILSLMTVLSSVYTKLTQIAIKWRSRVSQLAETAMGLFRISRSITVDARQCTRAETVATDLGFTNVRPGDWVIRGEDGESYILNDDFFQRTFAPAEERQLRRKSPGELGPTHAAGSKTNSNSSGRPKGLPVRAHRALRLVHSSRKRSLRTHLINERREPPRAARTSRVLPSPQKGIKMVKQSL